jgi:hypothetical protein
MVELSAAGRPYFSPAELPQHSPARNELLDGGGRWKLLTLERTVFVGGLVNLLDAIVAQHQQSSGKLCELFPVKNGFGFGAARHNRILADSPFVRHIVLPYRLAPIWGNGIEGA